MAGESGSSSLPNRRVRNVMIGNKSRDTKPEMAIRRAVHALGLRYRVAIRPEPALRRTADLVFTRARVAVFVDGCFWHGCDSHYVPSKTNATYWDAKILSNVQRDRETDAALERAGWSVIRVWSHEDVHLAAQSILYAVLANRERLAQSPPAPRTLDRDE